jgi:hypothetical protein
VTRGFRIHRPGDHHGSDLLVQVDRHLGSAHRDQEYQDPANVLAVLTGAPLLGGAQESHLPDAFLDLESQVLQDGGRGGQ